MHGIGEVALLVISWVVSTALCFAVVIGDERDLSPEERARAWPPSSRAAALVALGILALPFHFAKTRGEWWPPKSLVRMIAYFFFGIAVTCGGIATTSLLLEGVAWIFGLPVD